MKQFKQVFLPILLTALLLGASISFPLVYFQAQNRLLLNSSYPRKELPGKIDPQAEEIYLVQAIQQLYQDGLQLDADRIRTQQPALRQEAFRRQLEEMVAAGILDASATRLYAADRMVHSVVVNSGGLRIDRYMMAGSDDAGQQSTCHFLPEEKTGKLLYFGVGMQGHTLAGGSVAEISRRYIRYLGLDALEDWEENEAGLISPMAQLQVLCLQTENTFLLQIAPVGYYSGENENDLLLYFSALSRLEHDDSPLAVPSE